MTNPMTNTCTSGDQMGWNGFLDLGNSLAEKGDLEEAVDAFSAAISFYPNDTIVVGESRSRRLFDQLVGAATLIATPITILLQQSL